MKYDPMLPIWAQVANEIKRQVVSGSSQPGEKLPAGRDLALQYGINPNTAARIYQELEREGVCQTKRGMGTFVTEDGERICQLRQEMADSAIQRYLEEMRGLGFTGRDAIELIEKEEDSHAQK